MVLDLYAPEYDLVPDDDYDRQKSEARMNSFPQWTIAIEDINVHFVGLFSEKEDAIPILLIHGWPGETPFLEAVYDALLNYDVSEGSFLEFLPMLQKFQEEYSPSTLPYHFIVPSLPGYTFSSGPPLDRNFTTEDIARVLDQLMRDLGFGRGYVAQGGDIGSRIARILAVDYESCKGTFEHKA